MKWFLDLLPRSAPVVTTEAADELLVEPNDRGGWSLRFGDEPEAARIGNYPTPAAAERVARANVSRVRVVDAGAAGTPFPGKCAAGQ